jgi:hypothetical protein
MYSENQPSLRSPVHCRIVYLRQPLIGYLDSQVSRVSTHTSTIAKFIARCAYVGIPFIVFHPASPVVQRSPPSYHPCRFDQQPPRVRRRKRLTSPWPPGVRERKGRPEEKPPYCSVLLRRTSDEVIVDCSPGLVSSLTTSSNSVAGSVGTVPPPLSVGRLMMRLTPHGA